MPESSQKLPSQIPFIIGNEACERFSFYGMRNILTAFLIDYLLMNDVPDKVARTALAKEHFHDFVVGVYLFPLLGGWLADRYWGKYRTILWLSLVYSLGNVCLAMFVNEPYGFYGGLFLIALGSGGIKPCVSSMVGDQFTAENKAQASRVFQAFYWSVNLGSFFASAFIPILLKASWAGPRVAFGIPGALMLLATLIFWLGRHRYVNVPPSGPRPHGFLQVLRTRFTQGSWDAARAAHPPEAVEGTQSVLKVVGVFAPIPLFWALFDQKASTWVVQAKSMNGHVATVWVDAYQLELFWLCGFAVAIVLAYDWLGRTFSANTPRVALALVLGRVVWMLWAPHFTGWRPVSVGRGRVPDAQAFGPRDDSAAAHDRGHVHRRELVGRSRLRAATHGYGTAAQHHVAARAVRVAHAVGGHGVDERSRVRLLAGSRRDEGHSDELLVAHDRARQPRCCASLGVGDPQRRAALLRLRRGRRDRRRGARVHHAPVRDGGPLPAHAVKGTAGLGGRADHAASDPAGCRDFGVVHCMSRHGDRQP
jgi:MFS family permease